MPHSRSLRGLLLPVVAVALAAAPVRFAPPGPPAEDVQSLVNTMIAKVNAVNTLTYKQKKWERVGEKMHYEYAFFKYQRTPFRVYMKQYEPREVEVIYRPGWNNNKAKVNAGIVNVSLDINGGQMRENQHHSIEYTGFVPVAGILSSLMKKYGEKAKSMSRNEGLFVWNDRKVHKVVLDNPNFKFYAYTFKPGETVLSVAKRLNLCEAMILERNFPKIRSYTDDYGGTTVQLPVDYAKKTEMYIDAETWMPIRTLVYDDRGLYAKYEFYEVKLNPALKDLDFSPDNPEYGY